MEGGIPASLRRVQKPPRGTSAIGFIAHCILPPGPGEKLLHRLAPYQAVQGKKVWTAKVWQVAVRGCLWAWEAETGKVGMLWVWIQLHCRSGHEQQVRLQPLLSCCHHHSVLQSYRPLFSFVLACVQICGNCVSCWVLVSDVSLCTALFTALCLPLSRSAHSSVLQLPCLRLFGPRSLSVYSKACHNMLLSCPFPSLPGFPGLHVGKWICKDCSTAP